MGESQKQASRALIVAQCSIRISKKMASKSVENANIFSGSRLSALAMMIYLEGGRAEKTSQRKYVKTHFLPKCSYTFCYTFWEHGCCYYDHTRSSIVGSKRSTSQGAQ